jgi:hypothetical protein
MSILVRNLKPDRRARISLIDARDRIDFLFDILVECSEIEDATYSAVLFGNDEYGRGLF